MSVIYEPEYSSEKDAEERRREVHRLKQGKTGRGTVVLALVVILVILALLLLM